MSDKQPVQPELPKKTVDKTEETVKFKEGRKGLGDQTADQLNTKEKTEKKFDYKEYIGKKLDADALNKLKEVRSTIKAKDVLNLQETNPNIIAELFCEPEDLSKEWTFKTYGNKSVEGCIGLVDVYRNDMSVRAVTVANKKGKTKKGKREGMGGNFYTGHGYIFIFEGYKVTPTEKLSENDTKELNEKFTNETAKQTTELKDKVPENLQKRFGEKLLPRLVQESVRQGVDSKYMLDILAEENGPEDNEFGTRSPSSATGFLNQLRWAATRVKNNEMNYDSNEKKAKDEKQKYTAEFKAFDQRKSIEGKYSEVALDQNKDVVKQVKSKLNEEQRANAEIIEQEFKKFENKGISKKIIAAAIVNSYMESRLGYVKTPGDNGDSIGLFQLNINGAGRGMSVADRENPVLNTRRILEVIMGKDGEYLRKRDKEGATVEELTKIFCKDIEKPKNVEYRMKERALIATKMFGEKIQNNNFMTSLAYKEAMERLSKSPNQHTIMEMPKNARLTSDYMWRGAISDSDGTTRSGGGWHGGIDIGMGEHNYQLAAPENGKIDYMGNNPKGAGYYITYKCPDKNGDTLYFTYMHCDQESWEQLKQSGKTSFRHGEALLKTGASGNATRADGKHEWHLHLQVSRQKGGQGPKILTDPFPYLPKEMQAQIFAYREKHKERYDKTMALLASGNYKNREGFRENETLSA